MALQSTSVAQPLVGSWITAGIGATAGVPITVTLGTATAGGGSTTDANVLFTAGQEAWLIDPNGSHAESVIVGSIPSGTGNTLVLAPKHCSVGDSGYAPVTQYPHVSGAFGTGTFIIPKFNVNSVFVQMADNGAGAYTYFGNSVLMTATYRCIIKLAKVATGVQPYFWSSTETSPGNAFDTSELWVLGGTGLSGDGYIPSFNVC
jgi:hypothetical protein